MTMHCTCNQFPELSAQTRHGHIVIPSWQYDTGFGYGTVQAPMQSVLDSTHSLSHRPGSVASGIRQSWQQSLPDFYIPPIQEPETDQQQDAKSDGHFNIDFVQQIVTYLSMLVVMVIDKCTWG